MNYLLDSIKKEITRELFITEYNDGWVCMELQRGQNKIYIMRIHGWSWTQVWSHVPDHSPAQRPEGLPEQLLDDLSESSDNQEYWYEEEFEEEEDKYRHYNEFEDKDDCWCDIEFLYGFLLGFIPELLLLQSYARGSIWEKAWANHADVCNDLFVTQGLQCPPPPCDFWVQLAACVQYVF